MVVCCDDGAGSESAKDYADRATCEFEKRGLKVNILIRALYQLEKRLEALNDGDHVKRLDVPSLFMLAKRDGPPTGRLLRVMHGLEQHGLPWRRAYIDDDRTWSVADQVGSLLQAAGGHPHEVMLPGHQRLPWSIGIDISRRKASARVAATLISPEGRLCGAWTADQARRENIDASVLRRLLKAAAHIVPEIDRAEGMLVVRDGRVFESERAEDYRLDLGGPVTLVELRKYNNPPLLLGRPLGAANPAADRMVAGNDGGLAWILGYVAAIRRRRIRQCSETLDAPGMGWDAPRSGTTRPRALCANAHAGTWASTSEAACAGLLGGRHCRGFRRKTAFSWVARGEVGLNCTRAAAV